MDNEIFEQDYLDMITNFINTRIGTFYSSCYTIQDIVNYCVSNVEDINSVDFNTICKLTKLTLDALIGSGHIFEYEDGLYKTKKYITPEQGLILEPNIPETTKVTKEIVQAFDEIVKDL